MLPQFREQVLFHLTKDAREYSWKRMLGGAIFRPYLGLSAARCSPSFSTLGAALSRETGHSGRPLTHLIQPSRTRIRLLAHVTPRGALKLDISARFCTYACFLGGTTQFPGGIGWSSTPMALPEQRKAHYMYIIQVTELRVARVT